MFKEWVRGHFAEERSMTSSQIIKLLEEEKPSLAKKIVKAAKKSSGTAYVGRYLLPLIKREGWLKYEEDTWKVNITPDRCAKCFKPIDEVYVIDSEERRFCSTDCADDFDDYIEDYGAYWDEYRNLFYDFSEVYPKINCYKKLKDVQESVNPITHIELLTLTKEIENIIWNPDYYDVVNDKGAEGPLAGEIYRIIKLLETNLKEFYKTEKNIGRQRPKQRKLYTIMIDTDFFTGPGKDSETFKNFKKKAARYKIKGADRWGTVKVMRRSDWYDELKDVAESSLHYENLIECPCCSSLVEEKYTRRAVDDYRYCLECCVEVERAGGFDDGSNF